MFGPREDSDLGWVLGINRPCDPQLALCFSRCRPFMVLGLLWAAVAEFTKHKTDGT